MSPGSSEGSPMTRPSGETNPDVSDEELKRLLAPGRGEPLVQWRGGQPVMDFTDFPELYTGMTPVGRLVAMVLLLALKDQAREVRFEPSVDETGTRGLRLFYEVQGEVHELVPPPAAIATEVLDEVQKASGLQTPRRRWAERLRRLADRLDPQVETTRLGRFRIVGGHLSHEVTVRAYPSPIGPRLFLTLGEVPSPLAEQSAALLRQQLAQRGKPSSSEVGSTDRS